MSAATKSTSAAPPPEQRYFAEAAKRKRPDMSKQFQEIHFSSNPRIRHLADDLYADHAALDQAPAPLAPGAHTKFLIMGAGIGGLLMAVKLLQNGFTTAQIAIVESGGGVGGTWYWNRFPGLHCDVEAYCYMPLLEETGYVPTQKYTSGAEIRAYVDQVADRFGLRERVLFRSKLTAMAWDDDARVWDVDVTVHRGPGGKQEEGIAVRAEFVVLASGVFPFPQVPRVAGLSEFRGSLLHTARWNYELTGGSGDTAFPVLDKLRGLRVGIIGTGGTAVQVVPELAKYAKELFVFQRTPSQVNPREQRDTDASEWSNRIAARPGWQRARMENLADFVSTQAKPGTENLVNDIWSKLQAYCAVIGSDSIGPVAPERAEEHIGTMLARDAEHSARARDRISQIVKDRPTADKLTPWYPTWCKRPTFSDVYLETFNNDNVHLVDTDGKGIESVTPEGVTANGTAYPLDVLVLATGYRSPAAFAGDPAARIGIEILGRNRRSITEKWETQGVSTLHGCITNGFPNLFFHSTFQASATANYHHTVETQSEHIAGVIALAHERSASKQQHGVVVEPSVAAEEAWGARIMQGAAFFSPTAICTPGYMNLEGELQSVPEDMGEMMKKAKGAIWPGSLNSFNRELERWRHEGMEGMDVSAKE